MTAAILLMYSGIRSPVSAGARPVVVLASIDLFCCEAVQFAEMPTDPAALAGEPHVDDG
jgi:hypothetical protein